ncbi:MAG: SRPBCC family protein [Anaerolineales bacterium]|nr:SRPBCC family protein [Anaerolineales bacterium]
MPSKNKTTITAEPNKQELFITREFDAPRELVYKAHVDPKLYAQWVGPHGLEMIIEEFEPVSGGKYRFIHKDKEGNAFAFRGTFHTISEELMIQTFEFEGMPEAGHVALDTMRLEKLPADRTRVTIHSVYQSVADRDGMIQSGMEHGVIEGYERLDDLLKEM